MARPSKMNDQLINAFKDVLNEYILFATDEELIELLNERLVEGDKIDPRTFRNWKAGSQEDNDLYKEFFPLIKKALIQEKKRLLENLQGDDKAWQRWAWIIERKFDEWNIKQKLDHTTKGESIRDIQVKIVKDGND
jgi:hypothetical protein